MHSSVPTITHSQRLCYGQIVWSCEPKQHKAVVHGGRVIWPPGVMHCLPLLFGAPLVCIQLSSHYVCQFPLPFVSTLVLLLNWIASPCGRQCWILESHWGPFSQHMSIYIPAIKYVSYCSLYSCILKSRSFNTIIIFHWCKLCGPPESVIQIHVHID